MKKEKHLIALLSLFFVVVCFITTSCNSEVELDQPQKTFANRTRTSYEGPYIYLSPDEHWYVAKLEYSDWSETIYPGFNVLIRYNWAETDIFQNTFDINLTVEISKSPSTITTEVNNSQVEASVISALFGESNQYITHKGMEIVDFNSGKITIDLPVTYNCSYDETFTIKNAANMDSLITEKRHITIERTYKLSKYVVLDMRKREL